MAINYNAAIPLNMFLQKRAGSISLTTQQNIDQLIKSLFANSEQGFAYDPNDLTTMFQDAAGTVPVTGAGQPVSLMLDKSKGLALGTNAVLNGDFSQGGTSWGVLGGVTFSGGKAVYDGLNNPSIYQSVPNIELGAFYKVRFTISNLVKGALAVRIGTGAFTFGFNQNKTYEVILPAIGSGLLQFPTAGSGAVLELSDISVKKLSGNHAYQTVSASRPILQRNATTGVYYLEFDGVDDSLQTNNIDFTATNKVSLFAGVRKLGSSPAVLVELSADSNASTGNFIITAPESNNKYLFRIKGTLGDGLESDSYAPPHTAVITARGSIATALKTIKVNNSVATASIATGSGNLGKHPLYIGRRVGTSLLFNGHIYSLIGIGRLTTDAETIALEKSIAKNTGVTLSV